MAKTTRPASTPTAKTYGSLDAAFAHFNKELFDGALPPCVITVQRHKNSLGYFHGSIFADVADPSAFHDEIALNPQHFAFRPVEETLSTLVHEMAHLWQFHFGKPSRNGYHNAEWADKMTEIGLEPEDCDGKGKRTGQRMTHKIVLHGAFDLSCRDFMASNATTLYHDRAGAEAKEPKAKKNASKTKYACPTCGLNVWGKPEINVWCGECQEAMEAEAPEGAEDGAGAGD